MRYTITNPMRFTVGLARVEKDSTLRINLKLSPPSSDFDPNTFKLSIYDKSYTQHFSLYMDLIKVDSTYLTLPEYEEIAQRIRASYNVEITGRLHKSDWDWIKSRLHYDDKVLAWAKQFIAISKGKDDGA